MRVEKKKKKRKKRKRSFSQIQTAPTRPFYGAYLSQACECEYVGSGLHNHMLVRGLLHKEDHTRLDIYH